MPDQQPIPVGGFVGEYKILEHLGTGGFGITYRVADRSLNVEFALKEYFPWEFAVRDHSGEVRATGQQSEHFRWGLEKFKAEGQTLAALSLRHDASPHIVKVFRFFETRGTAYILQEFVEGVPLLSYVASVRTPKDIERLFFQLCDGLTYIHRQGICHLDVKPENILITKDTEQPKLIDFGSAKRQDTGRTVALITPAFSAVEQYSADAEHGPYTDIYALATTFYAALTGENPPDAPTRVLDDKCPKMMDQKGFASFSGRFLNCVDVGMRVLPSERPDTVEDWLIDSDKQPSHPEPPPKPVPDPPPPPLRNVSEDDDYTRRVGRKFLIFAAIIVGVAAVIGDQSEDQRRVTETVAKPHPSSRPLPPSQRPPRTIRRP